MRHRNPIKSMTANMWSVLQGICGGELFSINNTTAKALAKRALVSKWNPNSPGWYVTYAGRTAHDAFTEGKRLRGVG